MKSLRQEAILKIIEGKTVETQDQLLMELKKAGLSVTQATISRDIKQLRLIKELSPSGKYCYAVSERKNSTNYEERLRTIFRESVLSFDLAQNIVVVKTMSGLAPAAGAALDAMDLPGLVGSLAGDDTVLLIMRTVTDANALCDEIHEMLK